MDATRTPPPSLELLLRPLPTFHRRASKPWHRRCSYIAACHRPCSNTSLLSSSLHRCQLIFAVDNTACDNQQYIKSSHHSIPTPQTHPSPHNHLPIPDPEPHTVTTNQKRLGPTAAVAASPNKPHQAKPQPRIYSKNGLQRPRRPSTLLPTPSLRRRPIPTTRRLRQPASSHGRPRSLRPSAWSTGLLRRPARLQPAAHAVPAAAHVPAAGLPSSRAISG